MVRLVDLEPAWVAEPAGRRGTGVSFLCPCCRAVRLVARFLNPLDLGPPPEGSGAWHRLGDEIPRLTISPARAGGIYEAAGGEALEGHWHGHVVDGEVRDGSTGACSTHGGGCCRGVRGHATGEHRLALGAAGAQGAERPRR